MGRTGRRYASRLAAVGGKKPYAWSLFAGTLPAGLALDLTTGRITGTPLSPGTTDLTFQVDDSLGWICERLGLNPKRQYAGGARGWIGDSPFIFLDTARVRALGWQPKLSIRQAVVRTVQYLQDHQWLLDRR